MRLLHAPYIKYIEIENLSFCRKITVGPKIGIGIGTSDIYWFFSPLLYFDIFYRAVRIYEEILNHRHIFWLL